MLHKLRAWDQRLAQCERGLAMLLLSIVLLLGLAQIVLRNVFAQGLLGAEETQAHLVLWLGFLGASLATYEERHLRLDILPRLLPGAWQPGIALLAHLGSALLCGLLCRAAWTMLRTEYQAQTTLTLGIATWIAQSIIPLGFGVMSLRFALRTVNALATMRQGHA